LTDCNQAFGRHLTACDARDDGKGTVALNVGEEAVVRVLQAVMAWLHDEVVVQRGENAGDGRLAQLAADGIGVGAGSAHDGPEVAQALDLDDLEKVDSRHLEVDAEAEAAKDCQRV
jgi:hypothetical protein